MGKPTAGLCFGLLYRMHVSQFFVIFFRIVMLSSSLLPEQDRSFCSLSTDACPNCLCSLRRTVFFSFVVMFSVTMRISSSSLGVSLFSSWLLLGCSHFSSLHNSVQKMSVQVLQVDQTLLLCLEQCPRLHLLSLMKSCLKASVYLLEQLFSILHLVCPVFAGIVTFLVD